MDFEKLRRSLTSTDEDALLMKDSVRISVQPPRTPRVESGGTTLHFFDATEIAPGDRSGPGPLWKTVNMIVDGKQIHVKVTATTQPMQTIADLWLPGSSLVYNRSWLSKTFPFSQLPVRVDRFIGKMTPHLATYHSKVTSYMKKKTLSLDEKVKHRDIYLDRVILNTPWEVGAAKSSYATKPSRTRGGAIMVPLQSERPVPQNHQIQRTWCRPHLDRLIVMSTHINSNKVGIGVADVDLVSGTAISQFIYPPEMLVEAKANAFLSRLSGIKDQRILLLVLDKSHTDYYGSEKVLRFLQDNRIELYVSPEGRKCSYLLKFTKGLSIFATQRMISQAPQHYEHYHMIPKWKENHPVLEAEIPLVEDWRVVLPEQWLNKRD